MYLYTHKHTLTLRSVQVLGQQLLDLAEEHGRSAAAVLLVFHCCSGRDSSLSSLTLPARSFPAHAMNRGPLPVREEQTCALRSQNWRRPLGYHPHQ